VTHPLKLPIAYDHAEPANINKYRTLNWWLLVRTNKWITWDG